MPFDFEIDPALAKWAERMSNGSMMRDAINAALGVMYPVVIQEVGKHVESGAMLKAFAKIDYATGAGGSGGIGDLSAVGDPFDEAPKHTISEFIQWYRTQNGGTYYGK